MERLVWSVSGHLQVHQEGRKECSPCRKASLCREEGWRSQEWRDSYGPCHQAGQLLPYQGPSTKGNLQELFLWPCQKVESILGPRSHCYCWCPQGQACYCPQAAGNWSPPGDRTPQAQWLPHEKGYPEVSPGHFCQD